MCHEFLEQDACFRSQMHVLPEKYRNFGGQGHEIISFLEKQGHVSRFSREIHMFSMSNARFLEKYSYFDGQGHEIISKYRGRLRRWRVFLGSYGHVSRISREIRRLSEPKCTRHEPQPLRKGRNVPDSSHSHFAKTEMRQTRATATSNN